MERMTIPDVKIDENTTRRSVIDAAEVKKHAMQLYWHLKKSRTFWVIYMTWTGSGSW